MPWETTDKYIRSGHRSPDEFQPDSLRTIVISEDEGIKAVVGKPKGKETMEILSFLFDLEKGWTIDKAKAWFEKHYRREISRERFSAILPFKFIEKFADKPLRIRGIAMTAGMSRNFNIYTPEELQAFAQKLVSAPVYVEHVAVPNAVGKVTKTEWDGVNLWYEAEIYDEEIAEKIRKGLIQHVSVGADYETLDILDGKVPHGLKNAELSLVAVPGIPETNIQIIEKLNFKEQASEPVISSEYILGFYHDVSAFLPEHFTTVWLDRENGILALMGRLRNQPEAQRVQAIFFSKEKMWDQNKIRDWLSLHPHYTTVVENQAVFGKGNVSESLIKNEAKPVISVAEVISMLESVLPSPIVQRSWSLGPQRMCQELRRIILRLQKTVEGHAFSASSRG
ncbi:MAG: hypothetical protein QW667_07290 [Candidatus Bathyarchaeia archaeon]